MLSFYRTNKISAFLAICFKLIAGLDACSNSEFQYPKGVYNPGSESVGVSNIWVTEDAVYSGGY